MDNQDKHNENELRKQAPLLFSVSKQQVFIVPDGYFDALPTLIEDRIIEEEVEASMNQTEVSDEYFEQLESKILAQTIYAKSEQRGRVLSLRRVLPYAGIAAALIAAVLVIGQRATPETCETFACLFEEVGSSENILLDMSEDELIELLDDADLGELLEDDGAYEEYILEESSLDELLEEFDDEDFLRTLKME